MMVADEAWDVVAAVEDGCGTIISCLHSYLWLRICIRIRIRIRIRRRHDHHSRFGFESGQNPFFSQHRAFALLHLSDC
jgi:hypothetical protein